MLNMTHKNVSLLTSEKLESASNASRGSRYNVFETAWKHGCEGNEKQ